MSVFLRTRKPLLAAVTVTVAALSLTACASETGLRTESTNTPQPSIGSGTASMADSDTMPVDDSDTASVTDESSSASGGKRPTGEAGTGPARTTSAANSRVACTGSNTRTTAKPLSRPLNHVLLTATNTGSRVCDLYYHPAVRFDEAQSVPPAMEHTKPQAVTTLKPGESGYAVVITSSADGSGGDGRIASKLRVGFFDADRRSVGPVATPRLPAEGVHVDESVRVGYWLPSIEAALS
ncbi:DUF4232 domain-containing protein [Streptomyces sparsus]